MSQEEEPVFDKSSDMVPVSSREPANYEDVEALGRELLDLKLDTVNERQNEQKEIDRLRQRINNLTLLLLVTVTAAVGGAIWGWQTWQQETAKLQREMGNNQAAGQIAQLETELNQTNQQLEELETRVEGFSEQPLANQQQEIAANSEQLQTLQTKIDGVTNRLDQRQEAIGYLIRALENLVGESEFPDTVSSTSESKAEANDETESVQPQASPSPSPTPTPTPTPNSESNAPSPSPSNS